MSKLQITWTILPYGLTKNRQQRVSVVVSPRLTPEKEDEQVLAAFPVFLKWLDIVANLNFAAEFRSRGIDNIPLKLISEIDTKLWSKLFSEKTPVNGFEYKDMSQAQLRSYSIRATMRYLKQSYARIAVDNPYELPRLLPWNDADNSLKEMLGKAGTVPEKQLIGFKRFFTREFYQFASYDKNRFHTETEYELYRADRFYRRRHVPSESEWKRYPDFADTAEPPQVPEYDFHRIIASLAEYPELMRRLGLVLDFVLTENIQVSQGEFRLHLAASDPRQKIANMTPWTAFTTDGGKRFYTRSRSADSDQEAGLLKLHDSDDSFAVDDNLFDIYQVDPDGSALKTVDFVISAQNLIEKESFSGTTYGELTYTTGDRQGVAALRSGGLGVSRHQRAESVTDGVTRMTQHNDALEEGKQNDIVLFAEDVLRGYRVDVAAPPTQQDLQRPLNLVWHMLCARVGDYCLTDTQEKLKLEPDEGYIDGVSTTSAAPDSEEHYLHESLFRWTGWSLCTPRPGRFLMPGQVGDSEIQTETLVEETDKPVEDGCGVSATFKPQKGSLPRLRFGHSYRFRARTVDLAGNSLASDDPSLDQFNGASKPVGYWRFEPIDPPVIAHRSRVSEGESLERMVMRSNYNVSANDYLKETSCLADHPDFDYGETNQRHFVPPKSSQLQCETHGLFDPYFGDWNSIKKGYQLAAEREAGTLYDELPGSLVKVITPSALEEIATTQEAPGLPNETNPVGDRMTGGQYVIHCEDQLITPWLPDGAAAGMAIRAVAGQRIPGVNHTVERGIQGASYEIKLIPNSYEEFVILVYNQPEWPDSKGFRLILAEQEAIYMAGNLTDEIYREPLWNEAERTLTLFVRKGWVARLVYSSFANEEFIGSFGIPRWIEDDNDREKVRKTALWGANWLITPYRELTLVHATQAPVYEPRFGALNLERAIGAQDVKLSGNISNLHGPSTGKFEIEAKWYEWVDDPAKAAPERIEFSGQLGEINLRENYESMSFDLNEIVDSQSPDPSDPNAKRQRSDVHALGDTRFRLIKYRIRATTRFREYFPSSIYDDQDNVTRLGPVATGERMILPPEDDCGAPVLLNSTIGSNGQSRVLASSAPAAPQVMYVVPTMRWEANEKSDGHDVTRQGNGLRVWLDRPWFSSGDGELLGVVISQTGNGDFVRIEKDIEQFVTQWGRDPFWASSSLPKMNIKAEDFPACVISESLHLQENPDANVMIVGHRVQWDDERRKWYCDIELDPLTSYMPFVRLALVRYQPNAMQEVKISKVVQTDFIQVLPYRRATVRTDNYKITAALHGIHPSQGSAANSAANGRNRVELVLQARTQEFDSDLAWNDENVLANTSVASNQPNNPFWTATVVLPEQTDNKQRRLMIREFERFQTNASVADSSMEERLIFADIIPVTSDMIPNIQKYYINKNYSYTDGQKHHEIHSEICNQKPLPANCYLIGEYPNIDDPFNDAKSKLLEMYVSIWRQNNLTPGEIENKKRKIADDISTGKVVVDGCYYCMNKYHKL